MFEVINNFPNEVFDPPWILLNLGCPAYFYLSFTFVMLLCTVKASAPKLWIPIKALIVLIMVLCFLLMHIKVLKV